MAKPNDLHYETITGIRRDAGLLMQAESTSNGGSKALEGKIDGLNPVFHVPDVPIVDNTNDDLVTPDDIAAFVDGIKVAVASVDPESGAITLAAAPPAESEVIIRYTWSPATDDFIDNMRKGVEEWLDNYVSGVYNLDAVFTSGVFPNEWKNITRLRTAGYIQIQDWGTNVDTDGTSKDGYKKLEQAKTDLQDWISGIAGNDSDGNVKSKGSIKKSDRNIFPSPMNPRGWFGELERSDDCFHNRRISL